VRKLIVAEYVSLDGVIQAPGHAGEDDDGGFGQGGWTGSHMADHRRYNSDFYQTAGGFLLGRRTMTSSPPPGRRSPTSTTRSPGP
jgi:hypothetical protein